MPLQLTKPEEILYMWCIHPAPALSYVVRECADFAKFMKTAVERHPPSPSNTWDIVLYDDEVTPGD
eukprot:10819701-Karenia_brevis.AAC.1